MEFCPAQSHAFIGFFGQPLTPCSCRLPDLLHRSFCTQAFLSTLNVYHLHAFAAFRFRTHYLYFIRKFCVNAWYTVHNYKVTLLCSNNYNNLYATLRDLLYSRTNLAFSLACRFVAKLFLLVAVFVAYHYLKIVFRISY